MILFEKFVEFLLNDGFLWVFAVLLILGMICNPLFIIIAFVFALFSIKNMS